MSASPIDSASEKLVLPRFSMMRTVLALMLREMSTTYGRTPGGYLWVILQPLGVITMMTLIISIGLHIRSPALGTSFPIFYATGIVPFHMFNNISGRVGGAVPFSRALLFYPRVTFIDAVLARFVLNALTFILIFILMLGTMVVMFDAHTLIDPIPIMEGLGLALLLALGFGVLTGYLFQIFPVLSSVWSILSGPLVLLSGVLVLFEEVPSWGRVFLWYNPLLHIIGLVRRGFYPMYYATYASPLYVAGVSIVMLALGLLLLRRNYKDIVSR